ncbi:MAG: 6-bladed beta-propeller [Tannerellaceae bacterium]|jgi:hypothetical protein|nr:6-bladed beta-propeller [Tannerellaceae bacterium]
MKSSIIILLFLFVITGGGCVTDSTKENMADESGLPKTFHIPLRSKISCPLDSIFEAYEYVMLETPADKGLIGDRIRRILIYGDCFYLGDMKRINIFTKQGKFLRVIDHIGNGPGSYLGLVAFTIWPNGDVSILCRRTGSLYTYSKEDVFLKKTGGLSDLNPVDITCLDDSLLIVRSLEKHVQQKIHILNKNSGEVLRSYFPTAYLPLTYFMNFCFPRYEGKILLNQYQDNNIYELTPDSAILRYTIDAGGKNVPAGYWERQDIPWEHLVLEARQKDYISHIPFFIEGDRTIFLRFQGDEKNRYNSYALIDKQSSTSRLIRNLRFDDLIWEPEVAFPLEDGWMIIPIPAYVVFDKGATGFMKRFPGLHEESNPILCVAKIR